MNSTSFSVKYSLKKIQFSLNDFQRAIYKLARAIIWDLLFGALEAGFPLGASFTSNIPTTHNEKVTIAN